jgi:hypothetical protein
MLFQILTKIKQYWGKSNQIISYITTKHNNKQIIIK